MAAPWTNITAQDLEEKAKEYIAECMSHTKDHATATGKVIQVRDRHIPTINYFLRIWLPMVDSPSISHDTYYRWIDSDNKDKSDAIKRIDDLFKTLATDIVANEGKGIFYAKNKLGMHDKQHITNVQEQPLFPDVSKNDRNQ